MKSNADAGRAKGMSNEEIVLVTLKKEFKRLSRIAERAKANVDECINIGSEFIAIHNELVEIVESKEHGQHIINALDELKLRRDRAQKILNKDLLKLMDKQFEADSNRDSIGSEINMIEFRMSLRRKAS